MRYRYCLPSDIVTGNATITAPLGTVSTDPNYGLASLHDGNPAKPLKFTNSPAIATAILFDFGAAQRLDGIVIPAHNLSAGLAVRFQGHTSNSWGSPTLNAALTVAAADKDGHSKRPWVDLTAVAGYATSGFRYWRLYIPATSSVPIQLGEVCLVKQWRTWTNGLRFDDEQTIERRYIPALETAYGVKTYYDMNVKQTRVRGTVVGGTADYDALKDLVDDAGGPVQPFVVVLNDEVLTDGGCLMRCAEGLSQALSATWQAHDLLNLPVEFIEVSRGLPL
jgi:hypothetical protein